MHVLQPSFAWLHASFSTVHAHSHNHSVHDSCTRRLQVCCKKCVRLAVIPTWPVSLQVEAVSRAAKPLAWWALSVGELLRVGREADVKRAKVAQAEERLT